MTDYEKSQQPPPSNMTDTDPLPDTKLNTNPTYKPPSTIATTTLSDTIPIPVPKLDAENLASAIPIPTHDDNTPITSKLRSNLFLFSLLLCGVVGAYIYGFELLQPADHTTWAELGITLFLIAAFGGGVAWFVGVQNIDWWELVWGYWWFSMPIAGGAALILIRAMEATEEIELKD